MKNPMRRLTTAAVLAGALVAPASADALPYLSGHEACDQAREIVRDDFDAWRTGYCTYWRAARDGSMRPDRVYVSVDYDRVGARFPWIAYMRIREYRTHYTYTIQSNTRMGPRY